MHRQNNLSRIEAAAGNLFTGIQGAGGIEDEGRILNQSSVVDDSCPKRRKIFDSQSDGGSLDSMSSSLGLKLRKSNSFMDLVHEMGQPSKQKGKIESRTQDKLKASNFPAYLISIGSWTCGQKLGMHDGTVMAKIYYAKRKLVWEILDGPLKSKMEIAWSNIISIQASLPENHSGCLEIELDQPPVFERESHPQPKKHTIWHKSSDFTRGQASMYRRHLVVFPPGVLDKHYENLLQCDPRLQALSRQPFPSRRSCLFDPTTCPDPFPLNSNRYGVQPVHNQAPNQTFLTSNHPHPTTSDLFWPNETQTAAVNHQQFHQITNPASSNQMFDLLPRWNTECGSDYQASSDQGRVQPSNYMINLVADQLNRRLKPSLGYDNLPCAMSMAADDRQVYDQTVITNFNYDQPAPMQETTSNYVVQYGNEALATHQHDQSNMIMPYVDQNHLLANHSGEVLLYDDQGDAGNMHSNSVGTVGSYNLEPTNYNNGALIDNELTNLHGNEGSDEGVLTRDFLASTMGMAMPDNCPFRWMS